MSPKDAEAYTNRAEDYTKLGKMANAIADYSRIIQIYPDESDTFLARGELYAKLKKYDQASQDYTKAIDILPDAQLYKERAAAYKILGKMDLAIKDQRAGAALGNK